MAGTATRRPRAASRATNRQPLAFAAWRLAAGLVLVAYGLTIGPVPFVLAGLVLVFGSSWGWAFRLELATAAGLLLAGRAALPFAALAAVPLAAIALERGARNGPIPRRGRVFGLDPRRWPAQALTGVAWPCLSALGALLGRKGPCPQWLTVMANGGRIIAAPYRAASWRRWLAA